MLFTVLTVLVLYTGQTAQFDAAVSVFVAPYRAAWLLDAFVWLTTLGTGAALAGVVMTAVGFLWADRRTGLILPLWVAFAGAEASVWAIKYAVGRLVALIAFSRIFIGVHFGTDVVGGLLLGLFWLLIGVALAERGMTARPTIRSERRQESRE